MAPIANPMSSIFLNSLDTKADALRNGHPDKLNGLCDLIADLTHVVTEQARNSVTAMDCDERHDRLRKDMTKGAGATVKIMGKDIPVQVITSAVTGIGALTMWPTLGVLVFFFGKGRGWF